MSDLTHDAIGGASARNGAPPFPRHAESSAEIAAPAADVFAYLDDHARLAAHMSRSSWRMGGGRMELLLDEGRGQRVGSRMRLAGRVFGLPLEVESVVVERESPSAKVWQTLGVPRLLVIGPYRMGFRIQPTTRGCSLCVFIDYELPATGAARWLGSLLGAGYAAWCTRMMLRDAQRHWAG